MYHITRCHAPEYNEVNSEKEITVIKDITINPLTPNDTIVDVPHR